EGAAARAARLARQFVFDVQTHFVHADWSEESLLGLGRFAAEHWNHALDADALSLDFYKFDHYVEEIYLASDTDIALISAAPFAGDAPWLLSNAQMADTRRIVNEFAGERRMLAHAVFVPGRPGWLDDIDQAIEELKPDSWKGYTIGDPFFSTGSVPYRLDDEKLLYPAYEKFMKAGIRTVCIHKGLMPADYRESHPGVWQFANADDVGQAAKDWPGLNFMIYHSALRPFLELPEQAMAEFKRTGRIDWATDLAEVPERYGVDNVYAEVGSSFAMCCTTDPNFAAAFMGTLVRGMGPDRVVWGTDSVWYGSPQWQIEALRRLEIPAAMRKQHGFPELGAADGALKSKILGLNAAPLYGIDPAALKPAVGSDAIAAMKREWARSGAGRSNRAYGYVDPAPVAAG
ncbi:MAG: amidohydrolase family protein, partial [Gammaproteobacteria bacterium]|nr:amidohydrolase family protein [Gammaproteobacteria bacterium]